MIPETTREALLDALARFDREERDTPALQGWEERGTQRYALVHDGKRYPPKRIISLATGASRNDFSGGVEANSFLERHGFNIEALDTPGAPQIWWVNQGHSYDEARRDGFISAPQRSEGGTTPFHWRTMGEVRAGDIVVHCQSPYVRAIGRVTADVAIVPSELGGELKGATSPRWRAEVVYHELDAPVPLRAVTDQIIRLNIKNGPINYRGTLNQGYLWRFTVEGLRLLRAASDEPWPEWAEAALSAAPMAVAGWDEGRFFTALARMCDPTGLAAARRLYEFAEGRGADFLWNPGPLMMVTAKLAIRGRVYSIFGLGEGPTNVGAVWINFEYLVKQGVPTPSLATLAAQIRQLPGAEERLSGLEQVGFKRRPTLPLDQLFSAPGAAELFVGALDALLRELAYPADASGGDIAPATAPSFPGPPALPSLVNFEDLQVALRGRGLSFDTELVANYLLALQTKRFVILTGISGTGKTQLALAIADIFRPHVRATRVAQVPMLALDIEVKPYMVKHHRAVLPVDLTAGLLLPPIDPQTGAGHFTVLYPEGRTKLAFRKDPGRNVTELFFKGAFRAWFSAQLQPGDHVLLEPVDDGDEAPHALRFSLPRTETREVVLDNLLVTAVRPDWTDNRGLLGYYNPLTGQYARTPFLDLLLRASVEEAAAGRENRHAFPFFAILDEMNLARVEHYFADFLSALESEQPLHLHSDAASASAEGDRDPIPQQLAIPGNLFFTGTVNVDETTYMFSPKVLDRAFTLEFNRVDLRGIGRSTDLSGVDLVLTGFPGILTYARRPDATDWEALGALSDGRYREPLIAIHDLLVAENRHFGYRVANEIARFVLLAAGQAGDAPTTLSAALDLAVMQKVLPKLHGTQQELEPILTTLIDFAVHGTIRDVVDTPEALLREWRPGPRGWLIEAKTGVDGGACPIYPRTATKLWAMLRRLRQQGFTSFIE